MDKDKYVAMDVHKASVVVGTRDAAGKYITEANRGDESSDATRFHQRDERDDPFDV